MTTTSSALEKAVTQLAEALAASDLHSVSVVLHRGGATDGATTRNPSCEVKLYPTERFRDDAAVGAEGKSSAGVVKAVELAFGTLRQETEAKRAAAAKVSSVLGVLLALVACLFMVGCVSAAVEKSVSVQAAALDGARRLIEDGVVEQQPDGSTRTRRVTYDELVQIIYAASYNAAAVGWNVGVIEDEPSREAYAPRGGWIVAPVDSATGGR
jgi:hypothetical protein